MRRRATCGSSRAAGHGHAGLGLRRPGHAARLTRGTGRPEIVRAVLEGVAHRGADLLEAAEADGGFSLPTLRVDGGMSANKVFVQALADATARPVEVRRCWRRPPWAPPSWPAWPPAPGPTRTRSPPRGTPGRWSSPVRRPDRDRWQEACERAKGWVPELSALDFV